MKFKTHSLHCLMAALILPSALIFGEESKKQETQNGETHIQLGPISVAVSVSSSSDETKKSAYLGVVTSALSPQLRAQLNLAEGMGLSVDAVAKGSPAEQAGIKQYDVLKKFNDQMLCAQEQLTVLVKAAGNGAKATLGIVRGGKEQNVEVTLGEHMGTEPEKASFTLNSLPGIAVQLMGLEDQLKKLPHESGGIQDRLSDAQIPEEIRKRVEESVKHAQEMARKHGPKSGPDGGPRVFSFYPEEHKTSHNVVILTDKDGSVELTESNGQRTVKIKDASGADIFSGPLNTAGEHDAVPENFRGKVKDAEAQIKASATPAPKHAEPQKQDAPPAESKKAGAV